MNTLDTSKAYRSNIIFVLICLLCIISLLTDTPSTPIRNILKQAIYLTTYPLINIKSQTGKILDYIVAVLFETDYLKKENQTLKEDILRLRLAIIEKGEKNYQLEKKLKMAILPEEWKPLKLLQANVLETYQGALRIDRGSRDGISISQPVVVPEGVVGIIIETSLFSSVVATLHHRECRIGAMIQRERLRPYDGVIYPSGDLRKICTMNYIDIYDKVRVGDFVVTSPESTFPPGLPIGIIQAIHESGTLWKSADITPIVDPYKLDYVFIILDKIEPLNMADYNNAHISEDKIYNEKTEYQTPIQELLAP
ncbi:MAG: rod shape-determining protein MreC [Candidatus Hydrogenedens sp.]